MIQIIAALHQRVREARLRDAFPEIEDNYTRQLVRAMASLPRLHWSVLSLATGEGLSPDQIAERLDLSRRQSKRHLEAAFAMVLQSVERQKRKGW